MTEFLAEIIRYNPRVARSLKTLRRRAISAIEQAAIADTVLDARASPVATSAFQASQVSSVRGGLAVSQELVGSMRAALPLRAMREPDAMSHTPLAELELLALRTQQILRKRQSRERGLSLGVALVEGALLGLGGFMVLYGDYTGAAIVVGLAILVSVIVRFVWNPFARGSKVSRVIELADSMATDLRARISTLDTIEDHPTRQLTQWKAVAELTDGIPELS